MGLGRLRKIYRTITNSGPMLEMWFISRTITPHTGGLRDPKTNRNEKPANQAVVPCLSFVVMSAEKAELENQGHPQLHKELEPSLGYVRPYLNF